MPKIEIICVGSELLSGFINTNEAYISESLSAIGLKVRRIISVGDDMPELENAIFGSLSRSDIVIMTGGLGPTFDDITREAAAKVLKKPLVSNKEAMDAIAERFSRLNVKMPKGNERQAQILEGAQMIKNELGTAPGQIIESNGKILIFLPGPPKEMKPMMDTTVIPYLKKKYERSMLKTKTLKIAGMSESAVDEKIRGIVEVERELEGGEVSFTILAKITGIEIKISVSGTDEMIIDKTINNIKAEFYSILKDDIYGEDNDTLESVVGQLIRKKKKTLAVAESCTGGLLSHKITNVPGSSVYFKQGVVVYSNQSKIKMLGVREETIDKYGAVSEQVAAEMAKGIKDSAQSSIGISITGIAGPNPSSSGKPIGLVYIGLSSEKENRVKEYNFLGTRAEIKERTANTALDMIRRHLLK